MIAGRQCTDIPGYGTRPCHFRTICIVGADARSNWRETGQQYRRHALPRCSQSVRLSAENVEILALSSPGSCEPGRPQERMRRVKIIPANIIRRLPPSAALMKLNPQENLWDEIREQSLHELRLNPLNEVTTKLDEAESASKPTRRWWNHSPPFPYIAKSFHSENGIAGSDPTSIHRFVFSSLVSYDRPENLKTTSLTLLISISCN
jgi:hypothetical protein